MEVRTEDICIILEFRVTKFQTIDNGQVINTHFNIRDRDGEVHGRDFDNVDEPVDLLLCIDNTISNIYPLNK